jgi:hypothetical protein
MCPLAIFPFCFMAGLRTTYCMVLLTTYDIYYTRVLCTFWILGSGLDVFIPFCNKRCKRLQN